MKRAFTWLIIICFILVGCGIGSSSSKNTLKISSDVKFGEDDYQKIVSSNNKLGFEMLAAAPRIVMAGIFVSPTSLFMALAMVYNGADGETKKEMEKVLHTEGLNPDELNKANASLTTMLDKKSDEIKLSIANSIWLNDQYHFQKEFRVKNQNYFNAEIKEMNVQDSESPNMINDWVKQKTNNKIDKIVDGQLSDDIVSILINAIYFNGDWTYSFDSNLTEDRTFTLEDGSTKEGPINGIT